jgi:hypothetical protein
MSNKLIWTGRILSGLAGLFMLTSGINLLFVRSADLAAQFAKFGYPPSAITPIGLAALVSSLLYLIPQTAVLGAILLTGYLGGAVATHLRVDDPAYFVPIVVGVLIWLGIYLRDEKLRALIPVRK